MARRALRVTLAGVCRVGPVNGGIDRPVETRQGRLVLARLALAEGPVTRAELVDLLWPVVLPPGWARNVSVVVSRLRRLLAEAAGGPQATITTAPGVVRLVLPAGSVVDVVEAAALADRAADALGGERLDEALVAARASAAVARLPLLPGESTVWLDERRDWLRGVLARALRSQVEVAIRRGDPAGAAAAGELIELFPTAARGYADAMRLHLALGEPATALAVHTRHRRTVVEEAGLPEDATVEQLRARALAATSGVSVSPPSRPATASVVPGSATSFVGRRRELADLGAALLGSPLVTLTGPAGVGKTRLAREVARRLAGDFADGVRECRLAAVAHPTGVVPAVAAAVGAMPQIGRTLADSVVDALAPMRVLLLLDNCEHLLPAVAALAERIITGCPGVRVLATSRERIGADGETVRPLDPLAVPAADADPARAWAQPPEALQLLRERILSVRPGFVAGAAEQAALAEMCRRLDGLPLAIELAAARMSGMGVLDVAERLERRLSVLTGGRRTAPTRHRTLRAAIGWSYDLLDEPQRRVFERASVFSAGFTLAAAERVCGVGTRLGADETADAVSSLVDKSLLGLDASRGSGRYDMLETLREFARERLVARGEAEVTARAHAEYYVALADRADALVRGPGEGEGVAVFRDEMNNLRAAHAWARQAGRADLACALSAAVGWYAFFRMQTDLLAWAEQVPDAAGPGRPRRWPPPAAAPGCAATWRRRSRWPSGPLAAAGDDPSARGGWHLLANVALFRGELPRAADCYDRAARLADQAGDGYHDALLLGCRALVGGYAGDPEAAAMARAAAAAAARCGTPSALAWTDYVQGEILAASDPQRALTHLQHADAVAATVDAEFVRGVAGLTAASLHARHGEPTAAAVAVAELIDRWLRGGNHRQLWTTLREAAELLVRLNRPEAAATVLGAIEHADAENLWGADADRLGRLREHLREQLAEDLARPWNHGAALDLPALADLVRTKLRAAGRPGSADDGSDAANLP